MNNRGIEFSFGWIFAIIVGAAIIVLAIYGVSNFIKTEKKIEDSSRSIELSSLLKNIETGLEQQGTNLIDATTETRITNDCFVNGRTLTEKTFGIQSLKTSTSSAIGKKFEDQGIPLKSNSQYIFSEGVIEGKNFVALSQSFDYPFKVADVIILWSAKDEYCFVNAPSDVKRNIENLKILGVNTTENENTCVKDSKKVCFSKTGCDVDVLMQSKSVVKNNTLVYYDVENSALFYGAIFSDKEIYECQVQRLLHRASKLAEIYSQKSAIGINYGCPSTNMAPLFGAFSSQLNSTKGSRDIYGQQQIVREVEYANDALACKQF